MFHGVLGQGRTVPDRFVCRRGSRVKERGVVLEDELRLLEFLNKKGYYLFHGEHHLGIDACHIEAVEKHHIDALLQRRF